MFKMWLMIVLLAAAAPAATKTALTLMLEGRYGEARSVIDGSNLSPRYSLLFYALTEGDAARACSLYQVVAVRYPKTDCDSVARGRLQQAQAMGVIVQPLAEWREAGVALPPFLIAAAPPVSPLPAPEPIAPPEAIASIAEPAPPAAPLPEPPEAEALPESQPNAPAAEPAGIAPPAAPARPTAEIMETAADVAPDIESPLAEEAAPDAQPEPPPPAVRIKKVNPPAIEQPQDDVLTGDGRWFIQVGAFGNHSNAHRLEDALKKAGYPVKLVPRATATGTTLLQVRVGGYASQEECDSLKGALKANFNVPTVVISE